ncbi:unnamed protein product [Cuscuta campestris]|uniref:Thaumatin-like protein n=1 Tax=Cuscuta campestris TaxID=132261 RepID=A0A484N3K3_9ASTE|nr:unnamed protein product [Cuscuta campestris]
MGLMFTIKFLPILSLSLILLPRTTHASAFIVKNNCTYPVWAASIRPHGGKELARGMDDLWILSVAPGTDGSRIWGRTHCDFDSGSTHPCQTGDCGNFLECTAPGMRSATLAEFTLSDQPAGAGADFYHISNDDGFNIPMSFAPTTKSVHSGNCTPIQCDSNACPNRTDVHSCPSGLNYEVVFCPPSQL